MISLKQFTIILISVLLLSLLLVGAAVYNLSNVNNVNFGQNVKNEPTNATHLTIDYATPPYNNLVSYWNFDSDTSTTVYDLSNNSNDGTYQGVLTSTGGCLHGDCPNLDAINDQILASTNLDNFEVSGDPYEIK